MREVLIGVIRMPQGNGILLLGGTGPSTRIIYHALVNAFGGVQLILDAPIPRRDFLRRRVRRYGALTVAGQVGFVAAVVPVLSRLHAPRIRAIKLAHGLDDSGLAGHAFKTTSINSEAARRAIVAAEPKVVVVSGTRIIGRKTLSVINCPAINIHFGITPLYRGVHGGYWALAEGNPNLAGTTIHFLDNGIDTGRVISQSSIEVTREDSFVTYPYLHLAAGVPKLIDAVRRVLSGQSLVCEEPPALPSKLQTHPTLWGYLYRRAVSGVR